VRLRQGNRVVRERPIWPIAVESLPEHRGYDDTHGE
jgi:hypothetical protein